MDSPDASINPTPEDYARLRKDHWPDWVKTGLRLPPDRRQVISSRYQQPEQPPPRIRVRADFKDSSKDSGQPPHVPEGCKFRGIGVPGDPSWLASSLPSTVYNNSTPLYLGMGGHYADYFTNLSDPATNYLWYDSVEFGDWEYQDPGPVQGYSLCLFAAPYKTNDPSIPVPSIYPTAH